MKKFVAVFLALYALVLLEYHSGIGNLLFGDDFSHVRKAFIGDPNRLFDFWELENQDISSVWQLYGRIKMQFPLGTEALRVYWRPAQNVFLWVCARLFGHNFWLWHAAQYALVALAGALGFLFMVRHGISGKWALIASAAATIHPTRLLSIIWLSDVSDTLVALFSIAALLAYSEWQRAKRSPKRCLLISLALLSYFFALSSKEAAIPLYGVLFLYSLIVQPSEQTRLSNRVRTAFLHSLPFLALLVAYVAFRFNTPLAPGTISYDGANLVAAGNGMFDRSIVNLQIYLLATLLVLPTMDIVETISPSFSMYQIVLSFVAVASMLAVLLYKKSRLALFGFLSFFVMLTPTMFLPARGYFATTSIPLLLIGLAGALSAIWKQSSPKMRKGMLAIAILWVASLCYAGFSYEAASLDIPKKTTKIYERFYQKNKNLTESDRVYFINLWQWVDVVHGFEYHYLPHPPKFFVLTFDPMMTTPPESPNSTNLANRPTIGIRKIDDHTLEISTNRMHFMDVPQANMWLAEILKNPKTQTGWKGVGFSVYPVKRDEAGYPTVLRFVFTQHKLCDKHVHFFLQRGFELKKLNFCNPMGR